MRRAAAVLAFLVALALPSAGWAGEVSDSPQARSAAADRYFRAVPFDELRTGIIEESAKQMPEAKRREFVSFMNDEVNWNYIQSEARASIVRHFTAQEILALAEFMGRPEGKSVMNKMKYYMADLMPVVQGEVKRAFARNQGPTLQ